MASAVYEFNVGCIDGSDHFHVGKVLLSIAKKFTFQKESGHQTNRLHWQGRMSLRKKTTKAALVSMFADTDYKAIDIRPTVKENTKGEPFYCLKMDTKVEGPWTETFFKENEPIWYPPQLLVKELLPYQQNIYDAHKYDYRSINQIIDTKGNIGKSTIACRMFQEGKAVLIPPINNYKDFCQFAYCMLCDKDPKVRLTIFVDMPRAISKDNLAGIYSSLETIKTGYIFDTRNKGRAMMITSPDIWVMTNVMPDKDLLSADRWRNYYVFNNVLTPWEEDPVLKPIKKIK